MEKGPPPPLLPSNAGGAASDGWRRRGGEVLDPIEDSKLRLIVTNRQTVARLQHDRHDVFRPNLFLVDRIVERLFIRPYDEFLQMAPVFHDVFSHDTSQRVADLLGCRSSYAIANHIRQTNIIAN
jgi:hypothetical protein